MKDFFARGQISDEPGPAALLRTGRFQQRRRYSRKLNALRACGADDGTATRTPSAWMISPLLLATGKILLQIVFLVWVTLNEQKWVTLAKRRSIVCRCLVLDYGPRKRMRDFTPDYRLPLLGL